MAQKQGPCEFLHLLSIAEAPLFHPFFHGKKKGCSFSETNHPNAPEPVHPALIQTLQNAPESADKLLYFWR